MNSLFFSLGSMFRLMAPPPSGEDGAPMFMTFLPLIAIVGIFYFLIIRPQSKKQKDTQKMLSALKKGDKIVTIGGIHGTIQTVRENSLIVRVDENTKLEFSRSAISTVVSQGKEEKEDKKSDEAEDDKDENPDEKKD